MRWLTSPRSTSRGRRRWGLRIRTALRGYGPLWRLLLTAGFERSPGGEGVRVVVSERLTPGVEDGLEDDFGLAPAALLRHCPCEFVASGQGLRVVVPEDPAPGIEYLAEGVLGLGPPAPPGDRPRQPVAGVQRG